MLAMASTPRSLQQGEADGGGGGGLGAGWGMLARGVGGGIEVLWRGGWRGAQKGDPGTQVQGSREALRRSGVGEGHPGMRMGLRPWCCSHCEWRTAAIPPAGGACTALLG